MAYQGQGGMCRFGCRFRGNCVRGSSHKAATDQCQHQSSAHDQRFFGEHTTSFSSLPLYFARVPRLAMREGERSTICEKFLARGHFWPGNAQTFQLLAYQCRSDREISQFAMTNGWYCGYFTQMGISSWPIPKWWAISWSTVERTCARMRS